MKIAVIGGGAAGFFAAINAKQFNYSAEVVIFEKSNKILSKVKISGGGRCNVTNGCEDIKTLSESYPRGGRQLKKALGVFSTKHTKAWFKKKGIDLYTQDDGRVFPTSDDSQTIIDCFLSECNRYNIPVHQKHHIVNVKPNNNKIILTTKEDEFTFDKVIIATGGSPKKEGFQWLEKLGHKIVDPVPSLFTFNMPKEPITQLMGVVANQVLVSIPGTKLKSTGPLLVTHWGMSGPAILKLSAFGARELFEKNYQFTTSINWTSESNEELTRIKIHEIINNSPKKLLTNAKVISIPDRLWSYLLNRCEFTKDKKWSELGKKGINKLVSVLTNDCYPVRGKTTFKEEFVTSGGIDLDDVNFKTMQSKIVQNLYFAGEVLNIDGITGGFNFQAAWTTAYIAAQVKS